MGGAMAEESSGVSSVEGGGGSRGEEPEKSQVGQLKACDLGWVSRERGRGRGGRTTWRDGGARRAGRRGNLQRLVAFAGDVS